MNSHLFAATRFTPLRFVARRLLLLALLCAALPVGAVDYYWDANGNTAGTGGTQTWNTNSNRWRSGSATGTLGNWGNATHATDRAIFGGTAGTVSVGNNIFTNALVFSVTGYTVQNGTITLTGANSAITVGGVSTDIATISSILAGPGIGLIKDGAGILTLTAVNTYSGPTTVRSGTLRLGGTSDIDVINRESAVTIEAGTFDLGNFTEDTGLFTLHSGTVTGGANAALGVNTTAALAGRAFDVRSGTVDVALQNPKYPVGTDSASVGLTKSTSGIVTMSRVNTYTGATTISGGTLQLASTGSIAGSTVAVNNTGILAGLGYTGTNGTTAATGAVTVASGGRLSPGLTNISTGVSSIGTLNTGAQTWNGGGSYAFQMNSVPTAGTAGINWDRVAVNGTLTLTSASPFTIQLMSLNAAGNAGVLQGFANTQSYSWSLLSAPSITGFAANKFTVDSTAFASFNPLGGGSFSIAGTATSLSLVFTPVPEPKDYAMILGAITLGLVGYRRWRRPMKLA